VHGSSKFASPMSSVNELEQVFATAGGPLKVLQMNNGPELVSQALQRFCTGRIGVPARAFRRA